MTDEEIRDAIQSAINGVLQEKRPLNFELAHEWSIAQRLAMHMEPHFCHEWDIDCEYDRDGQLKKTLEGIKGCDARKKTNEILPDIIVHHREAEGRAHNLLVIELKKSAEEDPCDRRKLELLTNPRSHYQYELGLYVNIDGGNFTCTWYKDGEKLT